MHPYHRVVTPPLTSRDTAGNLLLDEITANGIDGDTRIISVALGGIPIAVPLWQRFRQRPHVLPISKILADEHDDRFGIGAASANSELAYNYDLIDFLELDPEAVARAGLRAKSRLLAKSEPLADYCIDSEDNLGSNILIVDDGVASGFTLQAGIDSVKRTHPKSQIVVATPVIHDTAKKILEQNGNEVIALHVVDGPGFIVENYYETFDQLTPQSARALLDDTH